MSEPSKSDSPIPTQLRGWRFILLVPKAKVPTAEMKGWAKNRETMTLKHDDPRLIEHIRASGNYGVCTDVDRFFVAADTKEIEAAIEQRLPKTLTVQSPRHRTKHFAFLGHIEQPILCKPTGAGDPCADIKFGNAYVVGAGSEFKDYGKYEVIDDVPIASITEEQLRAAISEFIEIKKTNHVQNNEPDDFQEIPELNFPITNILPNLDALTQNGDELYGPHPLHGSETGANFHVNTTKNVWHCFRSGHESGGGPLQLWAVLNGIIKCEDCHKGALKGSLFFKAIELAREKGLVSKDYRYKPADMETAYLVLDSDGQFHVDKRKILETLKAEYKFITSEDTEELFHYDNGVYREANVLIKGLLEKWLGEYATINLVNEIIAHCERANYVPREEFNKPGPIIPAKNGLLNLDTLTLEPFNPKNIFTFKLDTAYNPEAKYPPKFLKAFNEWITDPDDRKLLQEWAGYHLLLGYPFEKLLFLYGTGRNGKTRYVITIQGVLGKEVCEQIALDELVTENRFIKSLLYGKLCNVSSEPSIKRALQTQLLKQLTGNDVISAEIKHKQKHIHFKNIAKITVIGNRYPRIEDISVAWQERPIIVKFSAVFIDPKTVIPNIENTWLKDESEKSGILNWMIDGLIRLLRNNGFTISKSSEELMLELQKASNSTQAFITECLKPIPQKIALSEKKWYVKKDLYDSYTNYCDDIGITPDQYGTFCRKLNDTSFIRTIRPRIEKKEERVWCGFELISWKSEEEHNEEKQGQQKLTEPTESTETASTYCGILGKNLYNEKKKVEGVSPDSVDSEGFVAPTKSAGSPDSEENLIAGHCKKWHSGACTSPGDPNCVVPANPCPKTCKDFDPIEEGERKQ